MSDRIRVRVSDIEGWADLCQDFDGRFVVVDDSGESFFVSGWMVEIEFPEFPGFTFDQILAGLTTPATRG